MQKKVEANSLSIISTWDQLQHKLDKIHRIWNQQQSILTNTRIQKVNQHSQTRDTTRSLIKKSETNPQWLTRTNQPFYPRSKPITILELVAIWRLLSKQASSEWIIFPIATPILKSARRKETINLKQWPQNNQHMKAEIPQTNVLLWICRSKQRIPSTLAGDKSHQRIAKPDTRSAFQLPDLTWSRRQTTKRTLIETLTSMHLKWPVTAYPHLLLQATNLNPTTLQRCLTISKDFFQKERQLKIDKPLHSLEIHKELRWPCNNSKISKLQQLWQKQRAKEEEVACLRPL